MPVSTSTDTSAICAPPTPSLVKPLAFPSLRALAPRLVSGMTPRAAQASFQAILLSGLSIWRMKPLLASRVSAAVLRRWATVSQRALRAAVAARREEVEIPPTVELPPEAPDLGN